jgi:L-cysteine S-thiosulfotransferase
MKAYYGFCLAFAASIGAGCDNLQSTSRLRLPVGSVEHGKAAFVALNCIDCHTVAGVELPRPAIAPVDRIQLGGDVARLRTVGDLLTAIIHPTDAITLRLNPSAVGSVQPAMRNVNEVMTVQQMVDLVRFLQPRYSRMPPPIDWTPMP